MTQSEKAIATQTALHFTDVTKIKAQTETIVGQFGSTQAAEVVSTSQASTLEVRLISSTIYFKTSSATVLENLFSLTAAQAAPAVNTWIQVNSTDSEYSNIAQTLTSGQAVGIYYPTKAKATQGATLTLRGVEVVPLSADTTPAKSTSEHSTVYIATKDHLPVSGVIHETAGKNSETKQATFTWGGTINVVTPSPVTLLSTLKG
jgi:hypothetical protein